MATTQNLIGAIFTLLGTAFVIVESIDLVSNWNNLNDADMALNILALVTSTLSILLPHFATEAINTISIWATATEALAISAETMACIPYAGMVVAAVGVVLLILTSVLDTTKLAPPSNSPTQNFVSNSIPELLAYQVTSDTIPTGKVNTFQVNAHN